MRTDAWFKVLFVALLSTMTFSMSGASSNATKPDEMILDNDWSTNKWLDAPLQTKSLVAGTGWTTHAFLRTSESDHISTGLKGTSYVSHIASKDKVTADLSRIELWIILSSTADLTRYFNNDGITVSVADDYDMTSNTKVYFCENPYKFNNTIVIYSFEFPESVKDRYMRVSFDTKGIDEFYGWLKVTDIFFYHNKESVSYTCDTENKSCRFVANDGELHLLATEYDSAGNLIREICGPQTQSCAGSQRIVAADDHTWTNKVADKGVPYDVNAPLSSGNYILIRAKSVNGDTHSPEVTVRLDSEGISTDVSKVKTFDASSQSEQWYDMLGRRVERPANGLYIRVKGGQTSKVRL